MARLSELERAVPFSRRHIGPSPEDQARMLALLGHASLDELARAAVPASILLGSDLDLPEALPEIDVLAELRALGHRNRVMTTMIGLGYYGTHTPQVVLRKVLENLLHEEEQLDKLAKQKIENQKRTILEGSQEWDILYRKYYNEEVQKLGIKK